MRASGLSFPPKREASSYTTRNKPLSSSHAATVHERNRRTRPPGRQRGASLDAAVCSSNSSFLCASLPSGSCRETFLEAKTSVLLGRGSTTCRLARGSHFLFALSRDPPTEKDLFSSFALCSIRPPTHAITRGWMCRGDGADKFHVCRHTDIRCYIRY